MKRIYFFLAAVGVVAAVSPATAGWVAGMVEDEGGPIMQAYVEAGDADIPSDLRLQCLADARVGVRYGMGSDLTAGTVMTGGDQYIFSFSIDGSTRQLSMQLEEMDGAFAAYLKIDDPLFRSLRAGRSLSIDDPTEVYHPVTFSLQGSARAIDQLETACR